MATGFRIDLLWYQIGDSDFVHAFFSTVCGNLEDGRWGSRFPIIMNELYHGRLEWEKVSQARNELKQIQNELSLHEPSDIIWDIENLSLLPPWGKNISEEITDLANYFVTSDGRNMISVIFNVFVEAEKEKIDIELVTI
jgi:2,3-bisphosphoglycerate-dependent phosphoglycerate mutase